LKYQHVIPNFTLAVASSNANLRNVSFRSALWRTSSIFGKIEPKFHQIIVGRGNVNRSELLRFEIEVKIFELRVGPVDTEPYTSFFESKNFSFGKFFSENGSARFLIWSVIQRIGVVLRTPEIGWLSFKLLTNSFWLNHIVS